MHSTKTNFYEAEKDWANKIAAQYTQELQNRREWLGLPVKKTGNYRLLDVACGPGMLSHVCILAWTQYEHTLIFYQALFDYVDEVRGIDIADRMVEVYNDKAKAQDLYPTQMVAAQGNIVATNTVEQANISGKDFFNFDMAGMANALHHMEDPALALTKLMQRLKPGGTLLLLEFLNGPDEGAAVKEQTEKSYHQQHGHAHHGHGHSNHNGGSQPHGIAHYGFTEERMQKLLSDAGCTNIGIDAIRNKIKFPASLGSIERTAFVVKGTKSQ